MPIKKVRVPGTGGDLHCMRDWGTVPNKFEVGDVPPIFREVLLLNVRKSTNSLKKVSRRNFSEIEVFGQEKGHKLIS